MDVRRSTGAILGLGGVLLLVGPTLPNAPFGGPFGWLTIAVVYLIVGTLLGLSRLVWNRRTSLGTVISVAVAVLVVLVGFRAWALLDARPELELGDTAFAIVQASVFVPAVAGFMTPLGFAERRNEWTIAIGAIAILLLAFALGSIAAVPDPVSTVSDDGFPTSYAFIYYGFWLAGGALLGVPLFLYGRTFQDEPSPIDR